jgi:hypothetical protein
VWLKLAGATRQWLTLPLRSGLVFWFGGGAAWLWSVAQPGALLRFVEGAPAETLVSPQAGAFLARLAALSDGQAVVVVLTATLVVTLGQIVVRRLAFVLLRLLEGYHWPGLLSGFSVCLWDKLLYARRESRLQELGGRYLGEQAPPLSPAETQEYALLDRDLMYLPAKNQRLPTRLGNLLRAYELRPSEKYGLDALICWPRLWLLLPSHVREEIQAARKRLDDTVQIWFWGAAFLVWSVLTWWAVPLALLQVVLTRRWLLDEATVYGELVESAYDLHRVDLYKALRWPLPEGPAQEVASGLALTAYLWRGTVPAGVQYADPSSDS